MTLDQAAKALGVRWRTLDHRMRALGWLIPVGGGAVRCGHAALSVGYLQPELVESGPPGRPIMVEVGYQITPEGLAALRASLGIR